MSENFTTLQRFDFLPFRENKHFLNYVQIKLFDYRSPEDGRLYDMKVVSGYAFLRTYYV